MERGAVSTVAVFCFLNTTGAGRTTVRLHQHPYSASLVFEPFPLPRLLFPAPSHRLRTRSVPDKRCPVPQDIATDQSKDKGENKEAQLFFFVGLLGLLALPVVVADPT